MQFWTGELIAVVILGFMGFILLTFVMAWLQNERGARVKRVSASYVGNRKLTQIVEDYIPGSKGMFIIFTSSSIIMIGVAAILLFAFDLWDAPMYVNVLDVNIQFIFVIITILTFILSMPIAAMYVWAKDGGFR